MSAVVADLAATAPGRVRPRRVLAAIAAVLVVVVLAGYAVVRMPERFGALGDWASRWTTAADSDGDGLADEVERSGWRSAAGTVRTDPERADTDGDGLGDGQEADEGLNPLDRDTDDDQLLDGREIEVLGTDAGAKDSDGDGFWDGFEVANADARGLGPLRFDVKISKRHYVADFAKGAVLGDLNREDSIAWLAGNLASGGSSLLPGVGWLVGGVSDVRDVVGSAIRADWVGSGFSAAGLFPDVGDAAAIPGKAAAFVARNPELAPAVAGFVLALKGVPERVKIETLEALRPGAWKDLRRAGADKEALARLSRGPVALDVISAAMRGPAHVPAGTAPFLPDGPAGEAFLKSRLEAQGAKVATQVWVSTARCALVCNPWGRIFDLVADGVAYESKVGYTRVTATTRAQVASDAWAIKQGLVKGAHWNFLPSAITDSSGPSPELRELLERAGIKYSVYPARTAA